MEETDDEGRTDRCGAREGKGAEERERRPDTYASERGRSVRGVGGRRREGEGAEKEAVAGLVLHHNLTFIRVS